MGSSVSNDKSNDNIFKNGLMRVVHAVDYYLDVVQSPPDCYFYYNLHKKCVSMHGEQDRWCRHFRTLLLSQCDATEWNGGLLVSRAILKNCKKPRYRVSDDMLHEKRVALEQAEREASYRNMEFFRDMYKGDPNWCDRLSSYLRKISGGSNDEFYKDWWDEHCLKAKKTGSSD